MLRLNLKVVRHTSYYIVRIITVMALISFSAIASPFAKDSVDGQLGYLSACLLAAVAYLYVIGESIPKLPFMTVLDIYAYTCIVFVIAVIVQACVTADRQAAPTPKRLAAIDFLIWLIVHCAILASLCRLASSRRAQIDEFPLAKYRAGLVALVQYCEKNKTSADIKEVTAKEYAHQKMQTAFFSADVPEEWAK